jgi:hypothetical protein
MTRVRAATFPSKTRCWSRENLAVSTTTRAARYLARNSAGELCPWVAGCLVRATTQEGQFQTQLRHHQ